MSSTKSKAAPVIESTAEKVKEATAATTKGFETTLAAVKEGVEKAAKGFESSQAKMKEGVEKAMKQAEELAAFGQGNLEALMKSSQIFATGLQDISKHIAAANKAKVEESVAFTKSLMGIKSIKEAVDLQSGYARSTIEQAVTETNKVTDATVKLAEQAIAPLTARMTLAVEKFGKLT